MFIAFEGIDASGKNTQAKLLAQRLDAELVSFPDYNTPSGEVIEGHLKKRWKAVRYDDMEEAWVDTPGIDAFVFQAVQLMNRMEHAPRMAEVIYKEQRHLIADRYTASGMVYGGMDGLEIPYLEDIHRFLPQPDLWLLIDIDPAQSVERRPERRDRYESDLGYMEKVANAYRELWASHAEDPAWRVINGRQPVGDVHLNILEIIDASTC